MTFVSNRFSELRRRLRPGDPANPHHSYTRFVRVMKVVLLAAALVMLAVVVIWPKIVMDDSQFRVGFANLDPHAVHSLAMVKARYYGLDSDNRPYTVTAERATPVPGQAEVYDLTSPTADFTTRSGVPVIIEATRGVLYQKRHLLDLSGKVDLYQAQGYELHSTAARVDFKTNTVTGSRPVTGQGPPGILAGEGFAITDHGSDVRVLGRSSVVLDGAGLDATSGTQRRRK